MADSNRLQEPADSHCPPVSLGVAELLRGICKGILSSGTLAEWNLFLIPGVPPPCPGVLNASGG